MKGCLQFPELLQSFFTDRLMHQRQASPHTIASYRDSFRLLLKFAEQRLGKQPTALMVEDVDASFVGAFLNHLEKDRRIAARSRNVRLAAIHSFFRYVALNEPAHSALAQRVLAIPSKRFDRKPIDFLTQPEVEALLAAPDQATWAGRRDHMMLRTAVETGLRVSELIGLRCEDIVLAPGAHVRCRGKGRKLRSTPLRGRKPCQRSAVGFVNVLLVLPNPCFQMPRAAGLLATASNTSSPNMSPPLGENVRR